MSDKPYKEEFEAWYLKLNSDYDAGDFFQRKSGDYFYTATEAMYVQFCTAATLTAKIDQQAKQLEALTNIKTLAQEMVDSMHVRHFPSGAHYDVESADPAKMNLLAQALLQESNDE